MRDKDPAERPRLFPQLPLPIALRESVTLDNFVAGDNHQLLHMLQHILEPGAERFVYCWGAPGCGKTHLLQAACQLTASIFYLPLSQLVDYSPEVLDGLHHAALVAIDDVDAAVGSPHWERALFDLYNRIRDGGETVLVVSGRAPPSRLGLALADLQSRLAWGLVFHISPLDDEGKIAVLRSRARSRGLGLPDEVAGYLLRHCDRDLSALLDLLDRLDRASLAGQRRLTVPFVKDVLEAENHE